MPRLEQPIKNLAWYRRKSGFCLSCSSTGSTDVSRNTWRYSEHWGKYCHAYLEAWRKAGHSVDAGDLAVAVHGFVGDNDREAKKTYLEHEVKMFQTGSAA